MNQSIVQLFVFLYFCEISRVLAIAKNPLAATQSTAPNTREQVLLPSAELVSLLQDKENKSNNRVKIDGAIEDLINMRVVFDPLESLNGPFYASVYQQGPPPLWEKLSFLKSNMKGQKYTITGEEACDKDVLNYSEIFGKDFYLCASGTFEMSTSSTDDEEPEELPVQNENKGIFEVLTTLFQNSSSKVADIGSKQSLVCPVDYTVSVSSGSVHFFGNVINLNIQGTGYLRTLYADPDLRIFTSPKDTTNTKWEAEGLRIVQVRSDLIDPSFVLP